MKIREIMLVGKRQAELKTREAEEVLSDRCVLVRNNFSLISPGTELALYTGTHIGFTDPEITWARYPLPPGYASSGTVEGVGKEVKDFRPGDRVIHYRPHADFSVLECSKHPLFPIAGETDERLALFARFGQIAYTAAAVSRGTGGWVLVIGAGIVGNLCAQIFRRYKSRKVMIADLSARRLELAAACGINARIEGGVSDFRNAVEAASSGAGADTVVEATGSPEMVEEALRLVNPLGEVILLGSTRGKANLDVYKLIHRKGTSLVGAHEGRYPLFAEESGSDSQETFSQRLIEGIGREEIKVAGFITDTVRPERITDAYEMLLSAPDTHMGILIDWRNGNEL